MISTPYRFALCCLLAGVNLTVSAQKVDSVMNVYHENFPQEKIHVQFDKRFYNPGETIWFKAYIMSGITPSDISKNFYAELINEKGAVVQRIVSPVISASAASSFTVPASYSSPFIHFRAFTTWMLNFDSTFLFDKSIPVITAASAGTTAAVVANPTSIRFFPEGGDLVAGLESVVAFKANDTYGMPVKVSGFIKDAGGKKVAEFISKHDGMGSFRLEPVTGTTYSAVWKDAGGKETTTPLPAPKSSGLVMALAGRPGSIGFSIKRSEGGEALKQVYVLAHMDQQMVYKARVNLAQQPGSSGRIPVDQLPSGVLQVTIFNNEWQPLAERIVFVNNNDYMFDAYVKAVTKNTGKRGKNILEVEIPDTLLSNLSLAVTDASVNVPDENEDNIFSRLLFSGEVRGYVHNAGYYFSSFADSVAQQLDLVMLTHGWRRFNWDDVVHGRLPQIKFAPDNYLSLKGSVVGGGPARSSANNLLNLIFQFKDSTSQFLSVPLEQGGKFATSPMLFYDTARIFYSMNGKKQSGEQVILNVENGLWKGPSMVQFAASGNEGLLQPGSNVVARNRAVHEQTLRLASEQRKVQTLQEVTIKARSKSTTEKVDDRYASGMFKGGDGYTFDLTSDLTAISSQSVFNYLQGRVAGLTISNPVASDPGLSWRGGTPDLYLDEMKSDAQMISSMSMADIAYIKVFRPPFMGGMGGGSGGAIAIYTKRGGDRQTNNSAMAGLSKVTVSGYTPVKEFYSPDYTQNNPMNDLQDLRTTLYWAPYIFLHKDKKKAVISFYNNDISKKLRVVIEGVNEAGKLTRAESIIE